MNRRITPMRINEDRFCSDCGTRHEAPWFLDETPETPAAFWKALAALVVIAIELYVIAALLSVMVGPA